MTATDHKVYNDGHSNEDLKNQRNGVLLRNRQIHGEFTVIPSSKTFMWSSLLWPSWFVATIVEPHEDNISKAQFNG